MENNRDDEMTTQESTFNASVRSTAFMRRIRRKKCFEKWRRRDGLLRILYATDLQRFPWVVAGEKEPMAVNDEVETSCVLCPGAIGRVIKLGLIRTCKTYVALLSLCTRS